MDNYMALDSFTAATDSAPMIKVLLGGVINLHGRSYEHADLLQLWAMVDEKAGITLRTFATYGTGNPMPDGNPGEYVGTYQINRGALVFHVFELHSA